METLHKGTSGPSYDTLIKAHPPICNNYVKTEISNGRVPSSTSTLLKQRSLPRASGFFSFSFFRFGLFLFTFRTLAALYPGRIDLGLGRAPGADPRTSQVLRAVDGEHFPALVSELLIWGGEKRLPADHPLYSLQAMPVDAPLPPIWLLGSSGASARMAGEAGMGYSFASHFSAAPAKPAFDAYRAAFKPSKAFAAPHAILGVSVICAPTPDEAEWLASGMELAWVRLRSGILATLPSPEEAAGYAYTEAERRLVRGFRELVVVGTPETVRRELQERADACDASELMIVCNLHSHAARLRSHELIAQALIG